jgi:brefeldin A-inhibited guanine nucleotide-exchange protein
MSGPQSPQAVVSASALIRPSLEKIKANTTGRKYAKLQGDLDALLEKLDIFLSSTAPSVPHQPAPPKPPVETATAASPLPAAGGSNTNLQSSNAEVGVGLVAGPDGKIALNFSITGTGTTADHVDSGHMPSSPTQASSRPVRRPGALADGAAREMMLVLRDAIDTRKPVVMEVSLDCLQKLVSFKLVQGPVHSINHKRETLVRGANGKDTIMPEDAAAPLQFAAQPPQAQAVELMCRCDDTGDEAVELRLLKALLTVCTAPTLPVHGQALLLAVRACYNVFLTSRSEVTQATAKATLTQIVNVVFQRQEVGSLSVVVPPMAVADVLGLPPADSSSMSVFVQQFLHDVASAVDPFGTFAEGVQAGLDDAFAPGDPAGPAVEELYDPSDPVDAQKISWRKQQSSTNDSQQQQQQKFDTADSGTDTDAASDVTGGGGGGYGGRDGTSNGGAPPATTGLASVLQKDAFLVFRALCKLSIRSADATSASEVTTLRGKILALELLKILLENSGPLFRSGDRYIGAIKQYLCLSLLKNCASTAPQAQRLCASIFLTLIKHFRRNLKAEVGVFYPMILLRPIEPPTGSVGGAGATAAAAASLPPVADTAQKAVALRCLQALCSDGQLLVDVFVNYDCDLGGANLFERTIAALVRVAQGSHPPAGSAELAESQALRYEALRCLTSALDALKNWYDAAGGSKVKSVIDQGPAVLPSSTEEGGAGARGGSAASTEPNTLTPAPELDAVEDSLKETWMERLAAGSGDADGTGGQVAMPRPPAMGSAGASDGRTEAELLRSWKAFKRAFEQGITEFNKKPKKGIAFLQSQGLLGDSPEDVARFLAGTRGLDKTLIGDYIGEREDFNLKVMHSFVDALDFTEEEFDSAIRKFLSGFRLPGEAQKIDRLMEKFAERYVGCNPDAFKSADVAYVLAYSVIMLNTDAHNPMVKVKMSKSDFMRNNRGINDGGDLPTDFMEAIYDRIVNNEIKMKDEPGEGLANGNDGGASGGGGAGGAAGAEAGGWLDTMMALIPGRQRAAAAEPTEAAIRRTHEFLREQAKGATFYEAQDGEAVRPMVDVAWAPTLGALSILFEEEDNDFFVAQVLGGFEAAVGLTSRLNMAMLQSTFVSSLARFTMVHAPARMRVKHALALRALLRVADVEGNSLGDNWRDILRCVSRFELLLQLSTGHPSDALLFAGGSGSHNTNESITVDSYSSIADMSLQASVKHGSSAKSHHHGLDPALPPPGVLAAVDTQELNRFFVDSVKLESDAVVDFVAMLCSVAREELLPGGPPRVFSLGKIVEIAHFNMGRIRLVWSRIWAVLSDFFTAVGCHENLAVSMYAVDSLRQLAMKFLERDELASFTFQNDFLRPFVALVRHSQSAEIRELVIRCVSQMVLARVSNIKSGWKSVFMVFTTAAGDESPHIVRLAFDTVEKIVREHFGHITETEATTFTDCVNCLVAFTNNPHSLDVSLNAIAFLRFCALELAEGDIGELGPGGLPEGAGAALDPNAHRIRPRVNPAEAEAAAKAVSAAAAAAAATATTAQQASSPSSTTVTAQQHPRGTSGVIRFTDQDEHMYFWFPLLAGLSELTFDPRQEIRYGALGVLFDILKFHGGSFTPQFWIRVYDSVLLPMFDHVRAEVTDTTTFTDEARRAEVDAWLYETCTATLQHMVDVVARYHAAVPALLTRTLDLLSGLIRRSHSSLAAVGVAALTRLALACGGGQEAEDEETWRQISAAFTSAAEDTNPAARELIQHRMATRSEGGTWSLGTGAGSRRLGEVKCRAGTQLLLAQACGEVYAAHSRSLPTAAAVSLLDVLQSIAQHATLVDADVGLRHSLAVAQAADGVLPERMLPDPPLLRLEVEAAQAYLSVLLTITACGPESLKREGEVESRLVTLCMHNLDRFEQQSLAASAAVEAAVPGHDGVGSHSHNHQYSGNNDVAMNGSAEQIQATSAAALAAENEALSPLAVATLKALLSFSPDVFKSRIKDLFPLLTSLISCETAPPEVQRVLSEVFASRIGSMMA